MSKTPRQLALNVFFMRFGHHPAAWRHPSARDDGRPDVDYWVRLARLAEQAKFHTFFLADFIGRSGDDLETQSHQGVSFQFEPFTLLSAIAAHTRHIGLVATANTNFDHPYNVARKFASLDHLSGGRAGWNVVSSLSEHTAKNFGLAPLTHDQRYQRAEEFVTLARALWDSWDDDAFAHPDRPAGRFFDPAAAHPVRHRGTYFQSEGLLDVARPIQGHPVLVQAGNSDTGRDFAAQVAEMTYSSAQSLDVAQAYYADVKGRMAAYGRDPDQLHITPGLSVVVAPTDQEAQDKFAELQAAVDFRRGAFLFGVDVSAHDLDGPLPELSDSQVQNGKGRFRQMIELARREHLTIRQLVLRFGVSRGHLQLIGSPSTVADVVEQWFLERGADGFNVVPPLLPGGFEDFVRLVVPELQRRGIFQTEYRGTTYRENLGLVRPANANRAVAGAAAHAAPQQQWAAAT